MENNTAPTICPQCSNKVKYIPSGVSKRTGKPYNEFWSCVDRECDFTWKLAQGSQPNKVNGDQMIMEEIQGINSRLDKLIKYVVEKLK